MDSKLVDRITEYFGSSYENLMRYHQLLATEGELRGLIGKREVARLWERHILNSAVLQNFIVPSIAPVAVNSVLKVGEVAVSDNVLESEAYQFRTVTHAEREQLNGVLVDVGSGAGLPGIVLACLFPQLQVYLIESMHRRVVWLEYVRKELGIDNLTVCHGRAEDLQQQSVVPSADFVTARAVASLDKLLDWTMPFLHLGGKLLALKGITVSEEVQNATKQIKKYSLEQPLLHVVYPFQGISSTTVLELTRNKQLNT